MFLYRNNCIKWVKSVLCFQVYEIVKTTQILNIFIAITNLAYCVLENSTNMLNEFNTIQYTHTQSNSEHNILLNHIKKVANLMQFFDCGKKVSE